MSASILYITASRAVGYSPSRGGRITVLPADPTGDIGLSIEALLAAMPGRHKHVYVLTTEVWSQAVTVESRSLRRIEKSQIPQLLAFEVEGFSGVSTASARTASQPLDAGPIETTYWVSQIDSARFAQAADAVAFNGGKLLGILHPAGLPAPLTVGKSEWTRLEQWDDMSVVVSRSGRETTQQRFLEDVDGIVDSSAAARELLNRLQIEPNASVELLKQSEIESTTAAENVLDLSREADLAIFLGAWSKTLQKRTAVPVILPVRARASAKTRRSLALAATAATVVAIAGFDYISKNRDRARVRELSQQVETLKRPIDSYSAVQTQMSETRQKIQEREETLEELDTEVSRYRGQLAIHRERMAALLKTLGENRPSDLMINRVENEGDSIRIVGRSVSAEAVTNFATLLATQLEEMNLSIRVPRREALLVTAEGGPYEFEYIISDGV